MKRAFAILLCMTLLVCLPTTAFAETEIKDLTITMELPDPETSPATTAICGTGYSIYGIDWQDRETGNFLEPGEKIQGGHRYYAHLWVKANSGYQFASVNDLTPDVNATVNGQACTAGKAYEYIAPAMVYVTYSVTIPNKGWIRTVDLTVQEPQIGQKPTYGATGPHYGSGNVSFGGSDPVGKRNGFMWEEEGTSGYMDPDATFAAGKKYSLRITLIPDEDYKFVPHPTTKVNGKIVEAYVDYDHFLVVNVSFPALTHTHTPSDWRTTGIYHYKVCTECGDMLDQEDHKGGTATCTEKAKCEVCKTPYGQDEPDHKWSPTYLFKDKTGHAWICATCKDHSEVIPHTPGPAATEDTPQTCKDCGYIIAPAKNHVHNLTKVDAVPSTCLQAGQLEHYTCSGCSDFFADAQASKVLTDLTAPLGDHVDEDQDGICDHCGAVVEKEAPTATEDAEPTRKSRSKDDDETQKRWVLPVVLAVSVFILASAATAMILIVKKKRGGSYEN